MPFKSESQRRFFGMCSTAEGRAKAKHKCPDPKTIHEFFKEDRKSHKKKKK